MITMNLLLAHLKDEIGEILYNTQKPDFYNDIINKKTLLLWSTYFPKIVKSITITQECGILVRNPQNGVLTSSITYKVPKFNPDDEYINYEQVYYPGNIVMNQASSNLNVLNGLLGMVSEFMPNNQFYGKNRYSFSFLPPDLLTIDPPPMKHLDFTVDMQRFTRLNEIPMYYFEDFKNLYLADTKISLFNKYKHLAKGGNTTYQGLEITTDLIADLESGKDERKELIEKFEKNYWKDPSRYAAMLNYDAP